MSGMAKAGTRPGAEAAITVLRERGERVTAARRAVIEALEPHDHLTADEISVRAEATAPGVHRTTVYRALSTLGEMGLIAHTHVAGSATIYHLTVEGVGHDHLDHAHVQCSTCGRLIDVDDALLAPIAAELDQSIGFHLDAHHAALLGTCRSCRDKA